jgi:PKD repeat protein
MEKNIKITIIFIIINLIGYSQETKKVLFLGNSYTYVNDLPTMLQSIATSFNDVVIKDQNTPGGYYLQQHETNATTLAKIASNNWDFVVLQQQSLAFTGPLTDGSIIAVTTLCDSIRSVNTCAEPLFYVTWGREYINNFNNYEIDQEVIIYNYLQLADDFLASASPVGDAWSKIRHDYPSIDLYASDGSHPSKYGTYLAACVFYASIFQKSPIGTTFIPEGINVTKATIIQNIASQTVLDDLSAWRIKSFPVANFTAEIENNSIIFTSNSDNEINYMWDFGDGNTSTLENPTHTYSTTNNYTVRLTVYSNNNCYSDTFTQTLNDALRITENSFSLDVNVYPNPSNADFNIKFNKEIAKTIIVNDVLGREVYHKKNTNKNLRINVSSWSSGMYVIRFLGDSYSESKRILVK